VFWWWKLRKKVVEVIAGLVETDMQIGDICKVDAALSTGWGGVVPAGV